MLELKLDWFYINNAISKISIVYSEYNDCIRISNFGIGSEQHMMIHVPEVRIIFERAIFYMTELRYKNKEYKFTKAGDIESHYPAKLEITEQGIKTVTDNIKIVIV